KKQTLTVIVTVLALSLLGIIAFLVKPAQIKQQLGEDVFKLTYQFLLLVVIGGALCLIYQEFQYQRDQDAKAFERDAPTREAERGLQRQLLTEVVEAYNAAKKVRRLLRAKATKYPPATIVSVVQAQPYDEQMLALMDTQLNFEQLERRAESNPHLFPTDTKLAVNLDLTGKYLNKILSEYADEFSKFSGEPPTQKL